MRIFVLPETLPTLVGLGMAAYSYHTTGSIELAYLLAITGLLLQIILMLYRLLSGVVALFVMFQDTPQMMLSISTVLSRLLGAPGPSVPTAPDRPGEARRII